LSPITVIYKSDDVSWVIYTYNSYFYKENGRGDNTYHDVCRCDDNYYYSWG